MLHIRTYAVHTCKLPFKGSESCLPKMSPLSGRLERFFRACRKWTILSKNHPLVKFYCRSGAGIISERKRHIHGFPWYVIHPLSRFALYNDVFAAILWGYCFIVEPLLAAFWSGHESFMALEVISSLVNALLLFQCFTWFITGYFLVKTKEVVLKPKRIVINYLKRYFFFDLVGTFPLRPALVYFYPDCDEVFYNLVYLIHNVKMVRLYSFYKRSRLITLLCKMSDSLHAISFMILLTIFLLHWITCGLFIYTNMLHYAQGYQTGLSVLSQMGISEEFELTEWYKRYIVCLHIITATFCGSGGNLENSYSTAEQLYFSVLTIFGQMYYLISFILIYLRFKSQGNSDTNYEEFIVTLNAFLDSKRLPETLKRRVRIYYENRFQRKYFQEENLISLLSEHLQHEIWLHSCQRLIEHVMFFKDLPKTVVGIILGSLKQEVYLPQDIILQAGEHLTSMFFISWGTVAVYTKEDIELVHLVDGMHFGMAPINKLRTATANYTYVAVEVTECFRWDKEGYDKCFSMFKGIVEVLETLYSKVLADFEDREEKQRKTQMHNIIADLQQGKILEKGYLRQKEIIREDRHIQRKTKM